METIKTGKFTLKQILSENWSSFLDRYKQMVYWFTAYNVWKVINCREPDGLGYTMFACIDHPDEVCHVPIHVKADFVQFVLKFK